MGFVYIFGNIFFCWFVIYLSIKFNFGIIILFLCWHLVFFFGGDHLSGGLVEIYFYVVLIVYLEVYICLISFKPIKKYLVELVRIFLKKIFLEKIYLV